ncbi:MAG TPA: hypothetical protein VKE40_11300 [Gemmataceae bacterium]|nr:hypothetical protein [Gemmataceae bacterium]
MDSKRPFLSKQDPTTRRWAVLDDDGDSAWLLVTETESRKPVADCFVYNCRPPEPFLPTGWDRSRPPPILTQFASDTAYYPGITESRIRIHWEEGGVAAAVFVDGRPVAFLLVGEKLGYSRGIATDGPYGHPWNETRFAEVFDAGK